MKLVRAFMGAACAASLMIPARAETAAFDAAHRSSLIDGIDKAMSANYIDPQITAEVRAKLNAVRSQLTAIADPEAFAKAVSEDLHAAGHDKHLNLIYSAQLPPPDDENKRT